jgi:hypothetical protein
LASLKGLSGLVRRTGRINHAIELSVSPVARASEEADSGAYLVRVALDGATLIETTFSAMGTQDEHIGIWYFARVFSNAEALPNLRVPTRISANTSGRPAQVEESIGCMDVFLASFTSKEERNIRIRLYRLSDAYQQTYLGHALRTRLDDVVAFGHDLENEIRHANPTWWAESLPGRQEAKFALDELEIERHRHRHLQARPAPSQPRRLRRVRIRSSPRRRACGGVTGTEPNLSNQPRKLPKLCGCFCRFVPVPGGHNTGTTDPKLAPNNCLTEVKSTTYGKTLTNTRS